MWRKCVYRNAMARIMSGEHCDYCFDNLYWYLSYFCFSHQHSHEQFRLLLICSSSAIIGGSRKSWLQHRFDEAELHVVLY